MILTDRAVKQLYNGIYYVRKALEGYGVGRELINIDNNYNLKFGPVDWDVERFYTLFKRDPAERRLDCLEEMIALYVGDYLECEYYTWADLERERLSKLYERVVLELSEKYIKEKNYGQAESILLKAYGKNPYSEDITELLLKLYNETGNKVNAVRHYNAYSALLKEELGITPGERLLKLLKT